MLFGVSFLWFSSSEKNKTPTQTTITPTRVVSAISAPRTLTFPGDDSVVFSYTSHPPQFPEELPSYAVTYPPKIEEAVASLAKQWGFVVPVKKPVPYVYDWIEKEKHMSVNTKTNTLSFSYFYPSVNSSMNGRLTVETVIKDITKAGLLQKSLVFVEAKKEINATSGEGLDSTIYPSTFISYQYKVADQPYPFIFTGANQYAATIRILDRGDIVSFSIRIPPFVKPLQLKKTISAEEILQSLNEHKGILVRAGEQTQPDPYKLIESFSSVEISSITIGYFMDDAEKIFYPIYIISGSAYGATTYKVTYYLRATL